MKIGVIGGTFDPIHNGHLWIAEQALTTFSLDKILFVPSGISYMKEGVLDVKHRVNMVKIAISDFPNFFLSTIESSKNKNSYTFETINELKELNPKDDIFFIIGFDNLKNMVKWKNPDIIFKEATILVALRGEADISLADEYIVSYKEKYNAKIKIIHCDKIDVSSTRIRQNIKDGINVDSYLPKKVLDYIQKFGLYKEMGNER